MGGTLNTSWLQGVTVVMPHIVTRERNRSFVRAMRSISEQTRPPEAISVAVDTEKKGSAFTRNQALMAVKTKWTAFLDDDDELLPRHLEILMQYAVDHEADVLYPCGTVVGGHDIHARCNQDFDADLLREKSYIPVTSLVRTELAQDVRFSRDPGTDYDDWTFYLGLLDKGARFLHVPVTTWIWHHWGEGQPGKPGNTSGLPSRW